MISRTSTRREGKFAALFADVLAAVDTATFATRDEHAFTLLSEA